MKTKHATILAFTCALGSAAFAQTKAPLTIDQARVLALQSVPGTVVEEETEKENGTLVHSFEIRPTGALGTAETEVEIDANTGKVVIENDDD